MPRRTDDPTPGERVLLSGTGSRWGGGAFRATVYDVRKEDKTVKVQYDDGGFKRFTREEFDSVLLGADMQDDSSLAFGTQDFEWSDDQYNPVMEVHNEVDSLKSDLASAVRQRDFLRAHDLKEKVGQASKAMYELRIQEGKLVAAVQRQDFLLAHQLNKELETMRAKRVQLQRRITGRDGDAKAGGADGAESEAEQVTMGEIFDKAKARAFRGGLAGAGAMVIQVSSLMWMRTTMNYQYRYGVSTGEALRTLYKQGGVPRFYRGIGPALAQGPLSRFGDTAANVGMLTFLNSNPDTKDLPVMVKTVGASMAAASWRIFLMPLDTVKTIMQVEGKDGISKLMAKSRASGPQVFYHGALGASAATFAGHYPWFATYNALDSAIPVPTETLPKLGRNALLGFCSSVVSDTVSNSLRVLKTYRQTSEVKVSYVDAAKTIIEEDGLAGLFGRGLKTRIMANGLQGVMFSVMWKYLDEQLNKKSKNDPAAQ